MRLKKIFYCCFVLILSLPLLQKTSSFKEPLPLKGAVENTSRPKFNLRDWFSGEFQNSYEKYINDNIGFRPLFVRIHNQLQFTLFKKANARGVVRGTEDYLYELNYIKAYNGDDFLGSAQIQMNVREIKYLQDTLNKLGKTFFICLAAGKASFYPEHFPEEYKRPKTNKTNYKEYAKYLIEYKVGHIDMNKWFIEMRDKDTCCCMLYPKYGIHWSYYGMLMAADSIIKYIEDTRNIDMSNIEIKKIKKTSKLQYTDYDIARGMNLLFQMKSEPMCYPKFNWSKEPTNIKPKTLVIADSFYWGMFNTGIAKNSFSLGGFWFYNNQVYPESFKKESFVNQVDIKEKILENEVIILLSTEANLSKFPWGFTENLLKEFNIDSVPN